MKISYNWLRQYIAFEESPEEIGEILTAIGLEVEGLDKFESIKGGLNGLVVGEVMEKWSHPNADKLSCTKVNVGSDELLPIVCGAPNVEAGQKVIVATVGTMLYSPDGSGFEIKKAKIRGEVSQGMICAEDEIGVGSSHDGIMVLDPETKIGTPAAELFDIEIDHIYEIGLTPNRADAASHFGVARDLRAALNHKKGGGFELSRPTDKDFLEGSGREIPFEVENEEACPRYVGLTLTDVKVKESPDWLKNRLNAIGVRPINNVVDITNYINHAFGQPLHAFDADEIEGGKVLVKTMPEGSKFTTLDEVERKLSDRDLMICNENGGMCIAGVFGGIKSGVTEKTTSVFLESAYFNPVWVRKTAKRHGLNTDASFRFERGIDPNGCAYAAKQAAILMVELAGAKVSSSLVDTHPQAFEDFEVSYRPGKANTLIGTEISEDITESILNDLDVSVESKGSEWKLSVPPFKVDVTREADVIEEVLRVYGYDAVPFSSQIKSVVKDVKPSLSTRGKEAVTQMLVAQGYLECMSNSLVDEKYAELSSEWKEKDIVRINNPLSSDLGILRPAMIFSGLTSAARNINRQQHNIALFEFGNIYRNAKGGYFEEERLALTIGGKSISGQWRTDDLDADWYQLKESVEAVFSRLGIDTSKMTLSETDNDWYSFGIDWKLGEKVILSGGRVNDSMLKKFDLKREVYHLECRWEELLKLRVDEITIGQLPKFPEVKRDLALLVDDAVQYLELERLAYQTERKILRSVGLFDVYEGKGLPSGKKSYALSFTLRDDNKTLTDKEVDKTMNRLMERFKREVGAELR